jgi:hypothetical protein
MAVAVADGVKVGVAVGVKVGVAVGITSHTLGVPEHEYPVSIRHPAEHPSLLVIFSSSQVSPLLTKPSPHTGIVQIEVQLSPSALLPSSQASRRPVWILPADATAANFVPSEERVTDRQLLVLSIGVHEAPLSVDV